MQPVRPCGPVGLYCRFLYRPVAISKFSPPVAPAAPRRPDAPSSDQATTQLDDGPWLRLGHGRDRARRRGDSAERRFNSPRRMPVANLWSCAEADSPYPMLKIDPSSAQWPGVISGHYETVKKDEPYTFWPRRRSSAGSFATPEIRFDDRRQNVSWLIASGAWIRQHRDPEDLDPAD